MTLQLRVSRAGFAPVKSMRHLALDAVELDARGAVGDRAYCLVDVARERVLRTVQHPVLASVVARVHDERGGALELVLPGGEVVSGAADDSGERLECDYWGRRVDLRLTTGPHAEALSDLLGRPVRLAAAPRGGVVFGDPVTVVTTASLAAVGALAADDDPAARFRPTLVVETDEPGVEDGWLGREVRVGGAVLRIGVPVPRCAVVDTHPVTGERDVRLLAALAATRPTNRAGEPVFGVFATCVEPGRVAVDA